MAFAPDGQHLVTGGDSDSSLRVWRLGTNIESIVHERLHERYLAPATTVAYSPDGNHLLTTTVDGTVQVQQCDVCGSRARILALAKDHATRQLTAEEKTTFAVP